eukprot:9702079-Lingulodinium_polyedra.AAC.1
MSSQTSWAYSSEPRRCCSPLSWAIRGNNILKRGHCAEPTEEVYSSLALLRTSSQAAPIQGP